MKNLPAVLLAVAFLFPGRLFAADAFLEGQRKNLLANFEASLKDTEVAINCIKAAKDQMAMNNCNKTFNERSMARVKTAGKPVMPTPGPANLPPVQAPAAK